MRRSELVTVPSFAPARGRQQQVGVAAGLGGEEGFLHHDEGAGGQGLMDFLLVRQRLRRVGTGDPQRLDLACTHRLEQPNGGQSRLFGQLLDTPVGRHFCTVFGIGRVAVAGQQVGQAAGFAAAHGIRLAGEREGPAPGLPICPVAVCRLISALFFALPAVD